MKTLSNHRAGPSAGAEFNIESIVHDSRQLPHRIVLHALQKWGKTSFAAHAPQPIFLMTRAEDGLLTLMASGQVGKVPHFPKTADSWTEFKLALSNLVVHDHPHKTLVVDTFNGAERLCHEFVCQNSCEGSWEKFDAFARGPKIAVAELTELLILFERLRARGMAIILLSHSQVRTFQNPDGPDYDRWEMTIAKETRAIIDRWADMVLFGAFETFAEKESKSAAKGKATGGQTRLIMTERHAAYDAGNRWGLPEEIECGGSAAEAWSNFITAIKAAKGASQ